MYKNARDIADLPEEKVTSYFESQSDKKLKSPSTESSKELKLLLPIRKKRRKKKSKILCPFGMIISISFEIDDCGGI